MFGMNTVEAGYMRQRATMAEGLAQVRLQRWIAGHPEDRELIEAMTARLEAAVPGLGPKGASLLVYRLIQRVDFTNRKMV